MSLAKRFFVSAGALQLISAGLLAGSTGAFAFDLSAPLVQGNLAVYPIHDKPPPRVLSVEPVDRALHDGKAEIVETANGFAVKNMSGGSLLVPFGMLLRGGSQDQVVAASQIIPPNALPTPIDTYCVDPFRTSPREGESQPRYASTGVISPSLNQRLSLLVGAGHSGPVTRLRQAGVWWSIDTIRSGLSRQTGALLTPRSPARSALSTDPVPGDLMQARADHWTDGLTLALDDARLTEMVQPIVSALSRASASGRDVVGAAISINGRWVGADLFQSHALFATMWPALARGYAIESIAERDAPPAPALGAEAVKALLGEAESGDALDDHNGAMHIRDGSRAVVTEIDDPQGRSVAKSFVPKPDAAMATRTPDGVFVAMLSSGQLQGRPIDTMTAAPILASDASRERWWVPERDAPARDDTAEDFASFPLWDKALLAVLAVCLLGIIVPVGWRSCVLAMIRRLGSATLTRMHRQIAGLWLGASRRPTPGPAHPV